MDGLRSRPAFGGAVDDEKMLVAVGMLPAAIAAEDDVGLVGRDIGIDVAVVRTTERQRLGRTIIAVLEAGSEQSPLRGAPPFRHRP